MDAADTAGETRNKDWGGWKGMRVRKEASIVYRITHMGETNDQARSAVCHVGILCYLDCILPHSHDIIRGTTLVNGRASCLTNGGKIPGAARGHLYSGRLHLSFESTLFSDPRTYILASLWMLLSAM